MQVSRDNRQSYAFGMFAQLDWTTTRTDLPRVSYTHSIWRRRLGGTLQRFWTYLVGTLEKKKDVGVQDYNLLPPFWWYLHRSTHRSEEATLHMNINLSVPMIHCCTTRKEEKAFRRCLKQLGAALKQHHIVKSDQKQHQLLPYCVRKNTCLKIIYLLYIWL